MKRLLLGTLLACFAFINTNAQDKNGPQITFEKTVHDYGTIENGADGTCEFKFTNSGKADLLISNCRASCGCTVPSWPRTAIKAGESETIKVKYDTKRTGGIYKTITITSNAVNEPNKVLTIKGTIKPPVASNPPGTTTQAPATRPTVKATMVAPPSKPVPPAKPVEEVKKKKRWFQFWKKK